jgi:predicted nucleotide-binding protein
MDLSEYPEKYWHFLIKTKAQQYISIINDLTFSEAQTRIIKPFLEKRLFTVSGIMINPAIQIEEIRLAQSNESQKDMEEKYLKDSHGLLPHGDTLKLLPFKQGKDFTDILLLNNTKVQVAQEINGNKIFIVHGHDEQARDNTARFIDKLGLESIILSEQASKGKTVIEKFEEHSSEVAFAVILLTPDDFGGSKQTPDVKNDRARQNVIFELGYFLGKLGREHVCALRKGTIENPSDYSGVIYIDMDKAGAWKYQLAKEMKTAGLQIDMNNVL